MSLALNGGTGKIVQKLIEDFGKLDKVIQKTNTSLNTLVSGMRTLRREAEGTANAMKGAATAMERAARSSQRSRSSTGDRTGSGRSGSSGFSMLGDPYPPGGGQSPSRPPPPGLPYQRPALPSRMAALPYGQALSGGGYPSTGGFYGSGAGTRFYGPGSPGYTIIPPGAAGGAGGPPAPRGPTINGQPFRPGAASYGPYGPPFGGGGGYPPVPPIPPFPGQPPGPQQPGGGAFNVPSNTSFKNHYATIASGAGLSLVEDTLKKSAEVQEMLLRLQTMGFSPEQANVKAYNKAFEVTRSVRGTDVKSNLELLRDIQGTIANPEESLALLPEFARMEVALARIKGGGGAIEAEMLAAVKGGEYRGAFSYTDPKTGRPDPNRIDIEKAKQFIQAELISSAVTGGTIDPKQLLQFMRSANYSGALLTDKALFGQSLAFMQALGASNAGTAIQGFEQQFGAGKMSEGAANLLLEMGILHGGKTAKSNPFMRKYGIGQYFIDPKAYEPGVQMQAIKDPFDFAQGYLFKHFQAFLEKHLGDTYTKASPEDKSAMELNYAGQVASRQPGARAIAEAIRVMALMNRDVKQFEKVAQLPVSDIITMNNPVVAGQAFKASAGGVQVAAGMPAMNDVIAGLNAIAGGLNSLSEWSKNNPTATKVALEGITAALVGLGVGGAGYIALTALSGPAGLLAALGAGLYGLYAGVKALEEKFPSPTTKEGWAKVPLTRYWFQQKAHDIFGIGSAPTGPMDQPGPAAPTQATMENRGARATPVPVHVVNMGDAAHATGQGLAHMGNKPQQGISGFDTSTSDINGLYYGLAGVP